MAGRGDRLEGRDDGGGDVLQAEGYACEGRRSVRREMQNRVWAATEP